MYNDNNVHYIELDISPTSPPWVAQQPEDSSESQRLLMEGEDKTEMSPLEQNGSGHLPMMTRSSMRALALLCACSLSIGSQ